MTLGLMFWILMLLWLVFSLWWHWPLGVNNPAWPRDVFLFILFLVVGWAVFGPPVK